jgi:hypothetical protein
VKFEKKMSKIAIFCDQNDLDPLLLLQKYFFVAKGLL